jgi:hypothetical protein
MSETSPVVVSDGAQAPRKKAKAKVAEAVRRMDMAGPPGVEFEFDPWKIERG